jgi:hypothetical protein
MPATDTSPWAFVAHNTPKCNEACAFRIPRRSCRALSRERLARLMQTQSVKTILNRASRAGGIVLALPHCKELHMERGSCVAQVCSWPTLDRTYAAIRIGITSISLKALPGSRWEHPATPCDPK